MNSPRLQLMLEVDEGVHLKPYVDTVGKITIGVGHNLTDDGITPAICQEIFSEDITKAMVVLGSIWPEWSSLDEVRQHVFLGLAFNLGAKLQGFHDLLTAARRARWTEASGALRASLWFRQVGHRGERYCAMLETGSYDPTYQIRK